MMSRSVAVSVSSSSPSGVLAPFVGLAFAAGYVLGRMLL